MNPPHHGSEPPQGRSNESSPRPSESASSTCEVANCGLRAKNIEAASLLKRVPDLAPVEHATTLYSFAPGAIARLVHTIGAEEAELVKLSLRNLHEAKTQAGSHPHEIGQVGQEVVSTLDFKVRLRFLYLGESAKGLHRYYYRDVIFERKALTGRRLIRKVTAHLRRYRLLFILAAAILAAADQIVQHGLSIFDALKPLLTWGAIGTSFIAACLTISED